MSLFKLTEVRPNSLPLLHHPEKGLSSTHHPLAPSSTLIMRNFCLVSSFSNPSSSAPPLSHPTPSLSIDPYSYKTSSWCSSPALNPPFHSCTFTHSFIPPVWALIYTSISVQTYKYCMLRQGVWITCCGN